MMDKNAGARLMPDEIEIKLVEKEATIKREKGIGQETQLFMQRNTNGKATG
jgi:hypothetical protein